MKNLKILLSTIIISTFLISCNQVKAPITKTGLYFDTVISITLYDSNASKLIDECFNIADKYEKQLSKTIPESDISKINNSFDWVIVSKETYDLVEKTLEYEELSDGKFSVVCGALVDLWDIPGRSAYIEDPNLDTYSNTTVLPSSQEISEALKLCGKDKMDLDSNTHSIRINTKGAKLDLGAVAKGYVADKMKEYLISQGVTSGIIQLGGNVLTIGKNPTKDNGMYSIGIAKPFSDDGEIITAVSITDESVVTSGNYQRYFEYEGNIYHHIIDLTTGYPADTGLNSVSVVCSSSTEADIMSTILLLSGKEKGAELSDSLNLTDAIFIDDSNNIIN